MRFRLWSAFLPGSSPPPVSVRGASFEAPPGVRLLLVDDDPAAPASMARHLEEAGHAVVHERTGEGGFFRATTEAFDVMLLSIALPDRSGLDVLSVLRRQGLTMPVLLLTTSRRVDERVAGLDAGADDLVVMPCALPELLARVRALVRRAGTDPVRLCTGDMVLDPMARTAQRAGRSLQLTMREFQLLEYLVRHRGEVVSRERLSRAVWRGHDRSTPLDNAIDVHIARLRRKVDGDAPARLIHTVRGVGFVFGEPIPRGAAPPASAR